ncbi:MAG: hypothetical protein D6805_02160 [Planctomycetota bacterium]|nr:MAG: hypothetical protein D6805_02160 [Planctomycetota bacterium]
MKKLLFLLFLSVSQFVSAQEIQDILLPSHGYFREGYYFPIAVQMRSLQKSVRCIVRLKLDPFVFQRSVFLPSNARRNIWFYIFLQNPYHRVQLKFKTPGSHWKTWVGKKKWRFIPVESWDLLWGIYGHFGPDSVPKRSKYGNVFPVQIKPLPKNYLGLEAFDFIYLSELPSLSKRKVLLKWVMRGGRLYLSQKSWLKAFGLKSSPATKKISLGLGWILLPPFSAHRLNKIHRFIFPLKRYYPTVDKKIYQLPSQDTFSPTRKFFYYVFFALYFLLFFSSLSHKRKLILFLLFLLVSFFLFPSSKLVIEEFQFHYASVRSNIIWQEKVFFVKRFPAGFARLQVQNSLLRPLFFEKPPSKSFLLSPTGPLEKWHFDQVPFAFSSEDIYQIPQPVLLHLRRKRLQIHTPALPKIQKALLFYQNQFIPLPSFYRTLSLDFPPKIPPFHPISQSLLGYIQNRFFQEEKNYLLLWASSSSPTFFKSNLPIEHKTNHSIWIFALPKKFSK